MNLLIDYFLQVIVNIIIIYIIYTEKSEQSFSPISVSYKSRMLNMRFIYFIYIRVTVSSTSHHFDVFRLKTTETKLHVHMFFIIRVWFIILVVLSRISGFGSILFHKFSNLFLFQTLKFYIPYPNR